MRRVGGPTRSTSARMRRSLRRRWSMAALSKARRARGIAREHSAIARARRGVMYSSSGRLHGSAQALLEVLGGVLEHRALLGGHELDLAAQVRQQLGVRELAD